MIQILVLERSSVYILITIENQEKIEKIRKFIHGNIENITVTLDEMRSEMILVLKINGFLRSIDKRIGNPINNFEIMLKYVYEEISRNEYELGFWNSIKLKLEYNKFRFVLWFYSIYYNWFINTKRNDNELVDLNINI